MKVVYFDGYCNLCNRFIDFLIRRDHKHVLFFAPMQGTTASQRLPKTLTNDLTTMAFQDEQGHVYTESTAALKAIASLGGMYELAKALLVLPGFLRDWVYRVVARNRYQWFGRRDTCRLPTPQERAQFLD